MTRASTIAMIVLAGCTSVPLDGFAHEEANAVCSTLLRCRGAVARPALTARACVAEAEARFEDTQIAAFRASLAAGRAIYHPDRADACLRDLANASCTATIAPESCVDVLEGHVGDGGACVIASSECLPSSLCLSSPSTPSGCGVCFHVAGAGDRCTGGELCDPRRGLACVLGRCAPPPGLDEACDPFAPVCAMGLICTASGTCASVGATAPPTLGQSCFGVDCATGLACVTDARTGASTCQTARTDGTCRADGDCPLDARCDASSRRCIPFGSIESGCLSDGDCQRGLVCTAGACAELTRLREPCTTSTECASNVCNGVCTGPPTCS